MSDVTDEVATIRLNGQSETLRRMTIAALLQEKDIEGRGVAVALNGAVVPRAIWDQTWLSAGDDVEIVRARQGG